MWNDNDKICSLELKCEEPREGLLSDGLRDIKGDALTDLIFPEL